MKAFDDAIERGLALLLELLQEDEAAVREFQDSQRAFTGGAPSAAVDAALGLRRHLEWFLLERPCESLGEVPSQALLEPWLERAEPEVRDLQEAFQHSRASAFEVTGVDPAGTIWTQDLFGLGEFPLLEPDVVDHFEPGDLVVGRVYPLGDGSYRLSAASSSHRNRGLLDALKGDLASLRATRRGSLRVQQSELERLFFRAGGALRRAPQAELVDAGLPEELAAEVVGTLAEVGAEERPAAVTETLNHLAFETDVDLEAARRVLTGLGGELPSEPSALLTPSTPTPVAPSARPDDVLEHHADADHADADPAGDEPVDVSSALARLDEARAKGADIEAVFRELEQELGLEEPPEADDDKVPDFPGVVEAVVGEYLWDVGREDPKRREEAVVLHALSRYGAEIGVFEELRQRELLDFAARWILDEEPESAMPVVAELGPFARWCEEQHAHPLWTEAGAALDAIQADLPRILRARSALEGAPRGTAEWWVIEAVEGSELRLLELDERHRRGLALESAEELRPGDLVRVDEDRVVAVYPAVLRQLISSRASR